MLGMFAQAAPAACGQIGAFELRRKQQDRKEHSKDIFRRHQFAKQNETCFVRRFKGADANSGL